MFTLGANLKGVDMEGSQMTGINLRVATLKNAKLKNCNLRGATLAGTDLEVSHRFLEFLLIKNHWVSHAKFIEIINKVVGWWDLLGDMPAQLAGCVTFSCLFKQIWIPEQDSVT